MGGAEVARGKPLMYQALCRWIPPVSSQPPAQDRSRLIAPSTVAQTGTKGRVCHARRESVGHLDVARRLGKKSSADAGHPLPINNIQHFFRKSKTRTFAIGGKFDLSPMPALGKKLSKNSQKTPKNRHAALGRRGANAHPHGAGSLKDLVARIDARARDVATAADPTLAPPVHRSREDCHVVFGRGTWSRYLLQPHRGQGCGIHLIK